MTEAEAQQVEQIETAEVQETTDAVETNTQEQVQEQVAFAEPEKPVETSFLDELPEDLRGENLLQGYKDVAALAKSHVELNKAFSKKFDKLSKEELSAYYTKMDIPESAEAYEFEPLDIPEGFSDVLTEPFSKWAHEAKLSREQANILRNKYMEISKAEVEQQIERINKTREDNLYSLEKDWGLAYKDKITAANEAITKYGGVDALSKLKDAGLDTDPVIIKAFAAIGADLMEDSNTGGGNTKATQVMTPAEAQNAVEKFSADNRDALLDRRHPDHKRVMEEQTRLYALAFPPQQ